MKTKIGPAEILLAESERYRALAKDLSLDIVLTGRNDMTARLVRDHVIRAETFKTAATLINENPHHHFDRSP